MTVKTLNVKTARVTGAAHELSVIAHRGAEIDVLTRSNNLVTAAGSGLVRRSNGDAFVKTRQRRILVYTLVLAGLVGACVDPVQSGATQQAITGEDGLAEAFQVFTQNFVADGQDQRFTIGFGFHPGLVTQRVAVAGAAASGSATLVFADGRVQATLHNVPDDQRFDLWFVKNVPGDGRTVRPDSGDQLFKIGSFQPSTVANTHTLDVVVGAAGVGFDLDEVVVTAADKSPISSVVASGARTVLEKRFFRERASGGLDPVTGATSNTVESNDLLIARGAQLFFSETFGGNGRTCGTCHPAENNLTIDPSFIAALPPTDPLFVAETNPALAQLENPTLLRHDALILENVDGFEDPTHKFVLRGVPHTLAMSTSTGRGDIPIFPSDGPPPDFRTGWGGDGAPGRGSLNEFAFGAIVQHFTRSLDRKVGVDFRVPTQDELDALEAFQLFSGRQHNPNTASITFREARAENGKILFLGPCVACHRDVIGGRENLMVDTDVERILINAPRDGGFGTTGTDTQGGIGTGRFNVPPLIEAADTGPFFHNNTITTIEDAVNFYVTDVFFFSPGRAFSGPINFTPDQVNDVAAFLRVINAAENIRQTRKRTLFVQQNRSSGNTAILQVAINDLQDAIDDLEPKSLDPGAVHALKTAKLTLQTARANDDSARADFAANALVWLGLARDDLFTANPLNEF